LRHTRREVVPRCPITRYSCPDIGGDPTGRRDHRPAL